MKTKSDWKNCWKKPWDSFKQDWIKLWDSLKKSWKLTLASTFLSFIAGSLLTWAGAWLYPFIVPYNGEYGVGNLPETKRFAKWGNPEAQYNLGTLYYNEKKDGKAFFWYQKVAKQKHAKAQYMLGMMYYNGKGITKNIEKALHWYQQAADLKYAKAEYNLAMMHYKGEGGKGVNQDIALGLYKRAAKQNHAEAQYRLALMHHNKEILVGNHVDALFWYQSAAKQGHAKAQHAMGNMYYNSKVLRSNLKNALSWYNKAIDNKCPDTASQEKCPDTASLYMLGVMHYKSEVYKGEVVGENGEVVDGNGKMVSENYLETLRLWEKAKAKGHDKAKINHKKLLDFLIQCLSRPGKPRDQHPPSSIVPPRGAGIPPPDKCDAPDLF